MPQIQHGHVTVTIGDGIEMPAKAGQLSPIEMQRMGKPRKGVELVCQVVADVVERHGDRLSVPGVDAAGLREAARRSGALDPVITDLEALLVVVKQANLLFDVEAHEQLRRVLAAVRAQEKFDPRITDLVPDLVAYFGGK